MQGVVALWDKRVLTLFERYKNRARVAENAWQRYLGASAIDPRRADRQWVEYRHAAESQRRAFAAFTMAKDGRVYE